MHIAVPILNWNGATDTIACLNSVLNIDIEEELQLSIIIMDNCSSDNSYTVLRQHMLEICSVHTYKLTEYELLDFESLRRNGPGIFLVQNGANLGFAGGINVGFRYAINNECNYVLLVNNDAVIRSNSLRYALDTIQSDSQIGVVAAKIIIAGTSLIDTAGDGCTFAGKFYKRYQFAEASSVDRQEKVFGFCGGGALIRTKLLNMVGLFDEDFFINHEDSDLSYRSQLAGWEIVLEPGFVIEHKVSQSMLKAGSLPIYYSLRNSDYVYYKNTPLAVMIFTLPERLLFELISLFYYLLYIKQAKVYWRAKVDFWKTCSLTITKRRKIMYARKIGLIKLFMKLDSTFSLKVITLKLYKFKS